MKKNYQPIAIRTLLQNDNKATGDKIKEEISAINPHVKTYVQFSVPGNDSISSDKLEDRKLYPPKVQYK